MVWRGTDGRIYRDGMGPQCDCGERGLTPAEEDAGRCELCDCDRESREALALARARHPEQST